jgi:hypothetical protein
MVGEPLLHTGGGVDGCIVQVEKPCLLDLSGLFFFRCTENLPEASRV